MSPKMSIKVARKISCKIDGVEVTGTYVLVDDTLAVASALRNQVSATRQIRIRASKGASRAKRFVSRFTKPSVTAGNRAEAKFDHYEEFLDIGAELAVCRLLKLL